jgi:phenol 2-monooxygenase
VMDILANTDFPDVRQKCLISSANEGNVLILPREGGYVFRMYVELDKLKDGEKAASKKFTQDDMIAAANRIIKPYSLDVKEIVWWSIYDIGHSITDKFDDVPEGSDRAPRVFTAGDACHTHSPKAGQGMNVSMQDTFNLGWKLVHVLQGRADPSLLRSYSKERLTEARRLVETDHEWSRIMSAPTTQAEREGKEEPRIIRQFKANLEFTGGTAVKYDTSPLFAPSTHQALAKGEAIGRRFHSAPVVRLSDAKQMQLGHAAEADARWRIYAFAGQGDHGQPGAPMAQLCQWLENDPASPVVRHTREGEDIDAIIDVRAIFQPTFDQLDYGQMPSLLKPKTGKLGLQDHEKIFCTDHKGAGDIYDMRGIHREQGCLIVVRPDQYVANVLPLDGFAELSAYFAGVLR